MGAKRSTPPISVTARYGALLSRGLLPQLHSLQFSLIVCRAGASAYIFIPAFTVSQLLWWSRPHIFWSFAPSPPPLLLFGVVRSLLLTHTVHLLNIYCLHMGA